MITIEADKTINVTRGDSVSFDVPIEYEFQAGDVLRFKVFRKKACEDVVLQKDFPIEEATNTVTLTLNEIDTRIGDIISKPVDYWYEVELNPFSEPQTIIGYDDDGAKIFRLYPEGKELEPIPPTEEEIGPVDKELSLTSQRPVQNQAVTREIFKLKETTSNFDKKLDKNTLEIALEHERINNMVALKDGSTTGDAELTDIRVGADATVYSSAGEAVRSQVKDLNNRIDNMKSIHKNPFEIIDLPCTSENYTYIYKDGKCQKNGKEVNGEWKEMTEEGFSPVTKCPRYLGFRIEGDNARLYLYILKMDNGKLVFDEDYYIDKTDYGTINYLRQSHNRFIKTDGEKYFYYKIEGLEEETDKVTLMGSDTFPESESDIIATSNVVVKNNGDVRTGTEKYYSVVLPSGCFYAVLNNKGMPTFLKGDTEDLEPEAKSIFNVSYETWVKGENGKESSVIEVNRGASFGFIPENVGAALLRLPDDYQLSDLCIYTDKVVKSNSKSGRRRKAKELGEKLIKDFSFESQKAIFWNDSTHPMDVGRRFYGVPYSSRWVNSHYLGFEVTPETVLNALNDPYSVAYDGGFINVADNKKVRDTSVSGHTEITGDPSNLKDGGGTGYGLVCSAFTSLICGNPYPQSNRGYTFDSNFVLEDTVDINSGEVLVKDSLSHCVFVDEIYEDGYSLYEAVDPCVAKTTHTCPKDRTTYAASNVRTSTLDKYIYSVINKDISGYDKTKEDEPENPNKLKQLLNFENITIANGSVRPWRGNKAVYGSWDKTPKAAGRDFGGSGIGVTIHNKLCYKDGDEDKEEIMARTFTLKTPSTEKTITIPDDALYLNISDDVTENGEYEIISTVKKREKQEDGTYVTNTYSVSEYFRYYNHDTVQLTFDAEGKAVFKNVKLDDNGNIVKVRSIAEDVEYVYVSVKGYGGAFDIDNSEGAMVIAKGKCYPDLAADTSRIVDVRAAIVSDPDDECWGKYSCATSPVVESEYEDVVLKIKDSVTKDLDLSKILSEDNIIKGYHIHGGNGNPYYTEGEPYKSTDFIPIAYPGAILTFKSLLANNAGWAIYDKNQNFILGDSGELSGKTDTTNGQVINVTIPDNACYIRFTMGKDEEISTYFMKVKYVDSIKFAESLIKEKLNQYKHIVSITEDTHIHDLADGIYHIDYTSGATIYYDEVTTTGLQDGLFFVNYSEDYSTYDWIAIGRDDAWNVGVFVGQTLRRAGEDKRWEATLSASESINNKVSTVNQYTNNNKYYPTVKLMVDYVQEQLANVGGGSGVDLVTEFEGIDIGYEPNQVYNANAVNEVLTQYAEHLEEFANTEYVDNAIAEAIGGIENGSY